METVLAIAFLAVLIALAFLWQKAKDAASKKLTQKVLMPKAYARGRELTREVVRVTSTAPAAEMTRALHAAARAALPKITIATAGDSADLVLPSWAGPRFSARLTIRATATGCTVAYTVLRWIEADGIVASLDQISQLSQALKDAIRRTDPTATLDITHPVAA